MVTASHATDGRPDAPSTRACVIIVYLIEGSEWTGAAARKDADAMSSHLGAVAVADGDEVRTALMPS